MRRLQRQSLRKKGPMREGKSIRVAAVNSDSTPLAAQQHLIPTHAMGPLTPQSQHQLPSAFQKLFTSSADCEKVRVASSHSWLGVWRSLGGT